MALFDIVPKQFKVPVKVLIVVVLVLILKPWFSVSMGHVGVTFNRLNGKTASHSMGTHLKIPMVHRVEIFDVRQITKRYMAEGASVDQQDVKLTLELIYQLEKEKVDIVAKDIGPDYMQVVVDPQFIQQAKDAVAQYPVEDVIRKRSELKKKIEEQISKILKKDYIIVKSVNLVNIEFSSKYAEAIEEKMVQAEGIKTAANKRLQAEENAKSRVIAAKAEAEEKRLLSAATSDKAIALEWIKKWKGDVPHVMTSDKGGGVLIDMRGQSQ